MELLRTPDERFTGLPGYDFTPHHVEVDSVRLHYIDEGPRAAAPLLLMHGEPSWSYLYRRMVPPLVAAGHRVIAPDLVGFGRSDKPARREDYTYQRHVDWMHGFVQALQLRDVTLVLHDWGGLIGLRLVAEDMDRYIRVVAANTGLPTGDVSLGPAFAAWQRFSQETPHFHPGGIIKGACVNDPPEEVIAAYDAPFPDESYMQGARAFPMLVPDSPDDPAAPANRAAWERLRTYDRPFLCAFSDSDPITAGGERRFITHVPGARDVQHVTVRNAGHFLQEDAGEQLAAAVAAFCAAYA